MSLSSHWQTVSSFGWCKVFLHYETFKAYLINMSHTVVGENHHWRLCKEDWDKFISGALREKEHKHITWLFHLLWIRTVSQEVVSRVACKHCRHSALCLRNHKANISDFTSLCLIKEKWYHATWLDQNLTCTDVSEGGMCSKTKTKLSVMKHRHTFSLRGQHTLERFS